MKNGDTNRTIAAMVVVPAALAFGLAGSWSAAEAQGAFELEAKLTASDAAEHDYFGISVAIGGNTAIVGAYFDFVTGPGFHTGSVYIFQRDHGGVGNWGEVKKLNSSDASASDEFGYSVDISGDTVIVGSPLKGDDNTGGAYVFERNEGGPDVWGEVAQLTPFDPTLLGQFGAYVAIDGDTVIVGAPGKTPDTGSAYIFRRDEGGTGNWGLVRQLAADDSADRDGFGYAVGISGDVALVAAPGNDAPGLSGNGAAYIFRRDLGGADQWGQQVKLTASDTAIVGANLNDEGELISSGAAYIFERDEGGLDQWGEVAKLTASDAASLDDYGLAVDIEVDTVLVGARYDDDLGSAYVYQRHAGGVANWGEVTKITAGDAGAGDQFAASLGMAGEDVIVGASFNDDAGPSSGSAYIFFAPAPMPTLSNWGITVMGLLVLVAGSLLLSKRRQVPATQCP